MKVRSVPFAFVSAAFFAAIAMTCGTANASPASNAAVAHEAYTAMQQGDLQSAEAKFSDAISSQELEPEILANALLNRALVYQQLGKHGHAIEDYTAALNLDVISPSLRSTALYNRGLSQQKVGKTSLAVEDYTAALLLNPHFAQAYYSRGNALRDSGQLLFALSDYERALLNKHPDPASVYYGSATTYLALRRPQDAKRAFNAALSLKPDFGQARAQLVLLGDENAKAEKAPGVDEILTGSVASLAGGTVAKKPELPKAIEPPANLMKVVTGVASADSSKAQKMFDDRVPVQTADAAETAAPAGSGNKAAIALEDVPAIPAAPAAAQVADTAPAAKPAKAKPAAPKPVQVAAAADETAAPEAADAMATGSVAPMEQTGWVVQIASATSEDAAWSTWKKMQARNGVLKAKSPNVVRADLGAKGVFYRVRLGGFDDQSSAKAECDSLKRKGVSCYVSKAGG